MNKPSANYQFFYGIDGAPTGWLIAKISIKPAKLGEISKNIALDISEVSKLKDFIIPQPEIKKSIIWIDMPLTLATKREPVRECDRIARAILRRKASSIFSPPCHQALHRPSYAEANTANRIVTERGLSKQSYNIFHKIKEAMQFARAKDFVFEAHPELQFELFRRDFFLERFPVPLETKYSDEGKKNRLWILHALQVLVPQNYHTNIDAIDAAVIAAGAHRGVISTQAYSTGATLLSKKHRFAASTTSLPAAEPVRLLTPHSASDAHSQRNTNRHHIR